MKQQKIIAALLVVCVLAAILAVHWAVPSTNPATVRCPIQPDTTVVVYGGSLTTYSAHNQGWEVGGVDPLSLAWIMSFLDWWHTYDSAVKPVFLNSTNLSSDCKLSDYPNVVLYIQPGGDAYGQQSSLGASGKANILTFLDKGGAYVGICAGWYYAAKDYYWAGDYYNWPDLLGRVPTVEGSITDIAEYPAYNVTRLSNGLNMIYYGGPTWGWRQTPNETIGTVLMTFASIPGNLPAAVKVDKMLLLSVHPEAYENDGIQGLTKDQRIANYKWLANAINSVAGTKFTVPQATSVRAFGSSQQILDSSSSLRDKILPREVCGQAHLMGLKKSVFGSLVQKRGREGEDMARGFLIQHDFRILEIGKNRGGNVGCDAYDYIVMSPNGQRIAVNVKYSHESLHIQPTNLHRLFDLGLPVAFLLITGEGGFFWADVRRFGCPSGTVTDCSSSVGSYSSDLNLVSN